MNAKVQDRIVAAKTVLSATVGLMLVAVLLVALAGAAQVSAKSTATIKRAPLSGSAAFPAVNGEAKWKAKGGERELEIQIQDAKRLAGKRLTVRIGGKVVGHMRVSALGRARLVRDTQAGQSVPTSVTGKGVRIGTAGGSLVASGRF
jgi:hypothetical protein